MKLRIIFLLILMLSVSLQAQEIDKDLLRIKERMEEVLHFTADIVVDVEAPFINMPTKTASMEYNRGENIKFESKDFLIFPKRGLDLTFSELFEHPFINVDRGFKTIDNQNLKVLSVIPKDEKADMAMATLYLDIENDHIILSEITTKNQGSYTLQMQYNAAEILPDHIEVSFAIENLKIPLNFMGSDTKIDRKAMKSNETNTGTVKLQIKNYDIR
ncbi:hypothetical protein SAMN04487907_10783 [Zunongwangia mangrovi]|uniref:Outer membrane lipoprotein-sorting protein n=1 Tax=Zunongwangia mangrovi TaxID=1334022 RepID=A0A1I1L8I9_9FLAO|nr:hypothetical protein [Zunongwangia mangrovi]SFC68832.1 hypothetical protein SAMN04487907_10783 [Zunongwangia mangrovi]